MCWESLTATYEWVRRHHIFIYCASAPVKAIHHPQVAVYCRSKLLSRYHAENLEDASFNTERQYSSALPQTDFFLPMAGRLVRTSLARGLARGRPDRINCAL